MLGIKYEMIAKRKGNGWGQWREKKEKEEEGVEKEMLIEQLLYS